MRITFTRIKGVYILFDPKVGLCEVVPSNEYSVMRMNPKGDCFHHIITGSYEESIANAYLCAFT